MATSTILTYNLKRKNIIDKKLNPRNKLFPEERGGGGKRESISMENEGSQQSSNDS
jgi:hypothetical protein